MRPYSTKCDDLLGLLDQVSAFKAVLIQSREIRGYFNICQRTIDRWLADDALEFPPAIYIKRRRYWRACDVVAWAQSRSTSRRGAE